MTCTQTQTRNNQGSIWPLLILPLKGYSLFVEGLYLLSIMVERLSSLLMASISSIQKVQQ